MKKYLPELIKFPIRYAWDRFTGLDKSQKWSRVVLNKRKQKLALENSNKSFLEISGSWFENYQFSEYTKTSFPEFDICNEVLPKQFDVISADQVFEHIPHPEAALINIHNMLNPGGKFFISVPFLVQPHDEIDFWRWTPLGLKKILTEANFTDIIIESWGNKDIVKSSLNNPQHWPLYRKNLHSLRNEASFPYIIWAECIRKK